MSVTNHLKRARTAATSITLMLVFASTGLCQTQSDEISESTASDPPEEITVYGEKTNFLLRKEFYVAQENLFDTFNALNSDDMLDVKCRRSTTLGTRKKTLTCTPKFVRFYEPLAGAAWDMMMDTRNYENGQPGGRARERNDQLWQEMAELVNKDPEMREAFLKLRDAKGAYEARHEE